MEDEIEEVGGRENHNDLLTVYFKMCWYVRSACQKLLASTRGLGQKFGLGVVTTQARLFC